MKRILFFLYLVLIFNLSCEKEDPSTNKGDLETATYNATTKSFTLEYNSGYKKSVSAVIDNSVSPPSASATLDDGTVVYTLNADTSGEAIITTSDVISNYKYVNKWIYENMSVYYLWNDKLSKNPNYILYPKDFFNSILYKYNATSNPYGDRFSWIQEDYKELLGNLSGVSSDEIGFEYIFVWADQAKTHYYALVLYPKHGTDAEAKKIDRGRFVTKINDQNITPGNYRDLFGGTGSKKLTMADWKLDSSVGPEDEGYPEYILTNSGDVNILMHRNFAENPVYRDSVYTIGDQKIGYLVYNFFARDKGDKSNDYDKLLMNRLQNLQSQGIDEMVLDLRYNSGGAVSSAIALASALVKDRSTSNVLTTSQYNSIVHNSLLKEYGANYNKDYFIDMIEGTKIPIPSLNLPRLYVLTSGWTASASEFIINGLKPYMDVVLIGETTYGKNVGSISIYEENDSKNKWGMQPIIVRYANSLGQSDFTSGFLPNYEVDEFKDLYLVDFGNTNDPLLGKALSLITGQTLFTRATYVINTQFRSSQIDEKASIKLRQNKLSFEMYDDVRGDIIKSTIKK
ncbi:MULTISPECIES: S41 family peptidase [unclassified Proteiniphilum]|jgi:C-terminal processing protease CtpA/Prc|uniref:S41 family peptidase n=1 Tax=unclassified Proteiniphilum TaxID=2622718 RepID=UPI00257EA06E|nr:MULTISPECIES: S41 family peptidase [unclassified Proteiniphilum]